jgi:hypothetical protein
MEQKFIQSHQVHRQLQFHFGNDGWTNGTKAIVYYGKKLQENPQKAY